MYSLIKWPSPEHAEFGFGSPYVYYIYCNVFAFCSVPRLTNPGLSWRRLQRSASSWSLSDLNDGPSNTFVVRHPAWWSSQLDRLLQNLDDHANAARQELDEDGQRPALAVHKERRLDRPLMRRPAPQACCCQYQMGNTTEHPWPRTTKPRVQCSLSPNSSA